MAPTTRPASNSQRCGFTLVELLTVMVVIGILVAMTAMMMGTVRESARKDQTRSLIATIDEILLTKWESYATRPLSIVIPSLPAVPNARIEVPPRESARVRLMMLRDLMRMEMPDRYSDINPPEAALIRARAIVTTHNGPPSYMEVPVTWMPSASVVNYDNRVSSTATPENASSEMLYLILATSSFSGVSAIEAIPKRNIADTDEDGMLEIVDAWGNAIRFLRWPVGYIPPGGITTPSADEFDFMHVDWGYFADPPAPPATMKPLLVSAGPDDAFNIRFTQDTETPYRLMTWPLSAMGGEDVGRSSPYYYVDPYLRQYADEGLLGELLDDASEEHLDNITNHHVNEST